MNKPKALTLGGTIGIVAPASQASEEKREKARVEIEKLGFNVRFGKSCFEKYGYLAGKDQIRAEDLNNMFEDSNIDGIICLRGGYGTPRILRMIDYDIIKKNPKVFMGYSDITAIHTAINQKSKLVTFHGPMAASDISYGLDEFSMDYFLRAITKSEPLGLISNPEGEDIKCLVPGRAEGKIIGGNLALIAATIGTPYEIDTKGKLLMLEDIGEEPYSIDRMLTQLSLSGKLQECEGIILGDWNDCMPKESDSLSLMEVFKDILVPLGKPVIYNLKAGHCTPKVTIPFGVKAAIDSDKCELKITEAALKS